MMELDSNYTDDSMLILVRFVQGLKASCTLAIVSVPSMEWNCLRELLVIQADPSNRDRFVVTKDAYQ